MRVTLDHRSLALSDSLFGVPSPVMVRHLKPRRARGQQSAGRRWLRRSLLGLAVLLIVFGIFTVSLYTWAWLSTDRSTIARALIWREADVGDQHRFPSRPIPTGGPVSVLPAGPKVDLRVPVPDGDNGAARLDDVLVGTDTRAFVVVHGGRVVYEHYDGDSGPKTVQTSFSVAKSFVSVLVGIAIDEGRIGSVEDPVTRYVPELAARDQRFEQIRLRDLLTMSSGLRYEESSFPSPRGDDTYTYYGVDLRKDALERTEIEQAPGKSWHYNNYNPLLLGLVLERATGMSVSDYMASRLWQPLGAASDASWSLDSERSGFEKMESGLNATALDHARFGLLLLHGGEWNRRRIVSREWVRSATRTHTATDFPNPLRVLLVDRRQAPRELLRPRELRSVHLRRPSGRRRRRTPRQRLGVRQRSLAGDLPRHRRPTHGLSLAPTPRDIHGAPSSPHPSYARPSSAAEPGRRARPASHRPRLHGLTGPWTHRGPRIWSWVGLPGERSDNRMSRLKAGESCDQLPGLLGGLLLGEVPSIRDRRLLDVGHTGRPQAIHVGLDVAALVLAA